MIEKMKPSYLCNITLPVGWECARFRKLFSFGKGLSITKEDLVDEGVPVISYGQVHSKANTGTAIHESLIRFVSESYLKTDKQALTQEGNFIFADTSEDLSGVGNCAFVNTTETLFAGYHSIIARPKDANMYPKYFAYQFLTDIWRDQIRAKVMGVKVFSISQKLLRDTTVFIPPIQEQKAIAKLLDTKCAKIDSVIADIEKQIETLQKYKKSLITEAVTKGLDRSAPMKDSGIEWIGDIPMSWNVRPLKYLTNSIIDGTHHTPTYVDDGVPFLRVTDITSEDDIDKPINLDTVARIPFSEHKELLLRCSPEKGDLLVSKNGTIGVPKIIDWDWEFSMFVSLCLIKLKKPLHNKWLYYYFKSSLTSTEIAFGGKTNTITNLHLEKIAGFKIPLPSIDEQVEICDYLDEKIQVIDELLDNKKQQAERLRQHKKSLIYEYVTGKKRVTEVN